MHEGSDLCYTSSKEDSLETVNKMISELENGNCSDGLNSCDRSTEDEEVFVNCNIAYEV